MRTIKLFLIPVLILSITATIPAYETENPDSLYDRILERYVTEDGMVDYQAIKEDKEFEEYIEYLSKTDPDALPSDKHRLAFWINAYNAFNIKGVLEEYPIQSVLDVGWFPHSFFIFKKFNTQKGMITLRRIERIFKEFQEPRVHFAIACASMSCPRLRTEAYMTEKLEEQLNDQALTFINNKDKNYLERETNTLYLSSVFKWYENDFIKKGEGIEDYVIQFLNPDDVKYIMDHKVEVKYLDYDWSLNEQK